MTFIQTIRKTSKTYLSLLNLFDRDFFKHFWRGFPIRSSQSIKQRSELTIITDKLLMMNAMTRSTVDDWIISVIFPIVDHDRPDLYKDEQSYIREFLQRKDEGKDVIRYALRITVQGMERVTRKRRRKNPSVMRFVKSFIDRRIMKTAMDEIYKRVCEEEKQWDL